jgi:hypothetical protein
LIEEKKKKEIELKNMKEVYLKIFFFFYLMKPKREKMNELKKENLHNKYTFILFIYFYVFIYLFKTT